jgi:hypothetical protein
VFAAIERDRRRQQRERELRCLQSGSPHRTPVGVAIAEAARPTRPDRDRAGSALGQPLQVLQSLAPKPISLDLKEVVTEGNNSKPAKTASNPKSPKPMTIARPRTIQRRVPSLPTMPWQDDGR